MLQTAPVLSSAFPKPPMVHPCHHLTCLAWSGFCWWTHGIASHLCQWLWCTQQWCISSSGHAIYDIVTSSSDGATCDRSESWTISATELKKRWERRKQAFQTSISPRVVNGKSCSFCSSLSSFQYSPGLSYWSRAKAFIHFFQSLWEFLNGTVTYILEKKSNSKCNVQSLQIWNCPAESKCVQANWNPDSPRLGGLQSQFFIHTSMGKS